MTDHLPECHAITDDPNWDNCICDQLRACEQRMMLLRYNEIRGWSAMKEDMAYDAALDACIAALQAMPIIGDYIDLTVTEMIAAINILREGQK